MTRKKVVNPPTNPRQAGRPRTGRIPSIGESCSRTRRQVCSRCQLTGHNRSRCTSVIPITPEVASTSGSNEINQPVRQTRTSARRCGNCRETGHTRRCCPAQTVDSSEEEG